MKTRSRIRLLVVASIAVSSIAGVPGSVTAAAEIAPTLQAELAVAAPAVRLARQELTLPWRANMVGLSYVGEAAEGAIRVLGPDGWGAWQDLHVNPDEAPDGDEAARMRQRMFSEPLWVGSAETVEVRPPVGARDVRLHAINTLGDATPVPVHVRAARALKRWLTSTSVSPAEAWTSRPPIISRRQWGADERIRTPGPGNAPEVRMVFIHHTAGSNNYSKSQSAAVVRGVYSYHVNTRGYSDIAYNFLVDRYGQVFEGRWGGWYRAVIGAHTKGFNTATVGVALMGTFDGSRPPRVTRDALVKLLAWKMDVHHVPPTGSVKMTSAGNPRYDAGEVVTLPRIAGHRQGTPTDCPGDALYDLIPSFRTAVDKMGHPKIYLPRWNGTLRPDGDGAHEVAGVSATFSRTMRWTLRFFNLAGQVIRESTGVGTSMADSWNGRTTTGTLIPSGRYRWSLDAVEPTSGARARSAGAPLYVVTTHADGSILRDANGTFVNVNESAKSVHPAVHASWYGSTPAVAVGPAARSWYRTSLPLNLRYGALLQTPNGARYIWTGRTLRRFVSGTTGDTFSALGYRSEALIPVEDSFIATLPPGPPVEAATVHPEGTAIQDSSGQRYVILDGKRRPMTALSRRSRYRAAEVVAPTPGDLALPLGSTFHPRRGALVRDPNGGPPWWIGGSTKRQFTRWRLFQRMGYTEQMLLSSSQRDLDTLTTGPVYG